MDAIEVDIRKNRTTRFMHLESQLQRQCVAWFRLQYPEHAKLLFSVPNGVARSRVEAAIMKAEGVTAGVSDLIFLEPRGGYGALCIEMKREDKSSRQSASQKEWQKAVEKAGNLYAVARSFEIFQAVVNEYMQLPPGWRVTVTKDDLVAGIRAVPLIR